MFYLDSSAIVKLCVAEAESTSLKDMLSEEPRLTSSALALTEVIRAVRSHGQAAVDKALSTLVTFDLIEIGRPLLNSAAELQPPRLRTLDAIHLASALLLEGDCEGVITYDARMAEAARAAGLAVLAPGVDG